MKQNEGEKKVKQYFLYETDLTVHFRNVWTEQTGSEKHKVQLSFL